MIIFFKILNTFTYNFTLISDFNRVEGCDRDRYTRISYKLEVRGAEGKELGI
ncbi:hypothetical protein [Nostoc sp. GT001]|uniref:hypothetical protein n=1 Tax=Nostoc sp. GT001 TaxID=3056647 RepID=UPI0025AA5E14|nr:hypothetical protein [Nostoc sp. GT001]MDM9585471.1 hypothetical protein [Nostoc sp. GT001]